MTLCKEAFALRVGHVGMWVRRVSWVADDRVCMPKEALRAVGSSEDLTLSGCAVGGVINRYVISFLIMGWCVLERFCLLDYGACGEV